MFVGWQAEINANSRPFHCREMKVCSETRWHIHTIIHTLAEEEMIDLTRNL